MTSLLPPWLPCRSLAVGQGQALHQCGDGMKVDESRCVKYGLNPAKVRSITRRLSTAAKEAQELGLTVFSYIGGSGVLRISTIDGEHGNIAELDGHFDGGDD